MRPSGQDLILLRMRCGRTVHHSMIWNGLLFDVNNIDPVPWMCCKEADIQRHDETFTPSTYSFIASGKS